jgi:hypothetical protein
MPPLAGMFQVCVVFFVGGVGRLQHPQQRVYLSQRSLEYPLGLDRSCSGRCEVWMPTWRRRRSRVVKSLQASQRPHKQYRLLQVLRNTA